MKDPKRYDAVADVVINLNDKIVKPFFWENPTGQFVHWYDYERLKAERVHATMLLESMSNKNYSLKVEVDRLRIEVLKLTVALQTADRVLKPLRDKAQKENESR